MDGPGLVRSTDEDLHPDAGRVQPDGIVDAHRDLLVAQLAQDRRPPGGPQDDRRRDARGDARAQDAAGAEEGVDRPDERRDVEIDPLEAAGRTLEVAVVDGQHHGPAAGRPEDPGEPVLHPPVVGARALQEEGLVAGRLGEVEVLAFEGIGFGHRGFLQVVDGG